MSKSEKLEYFLVNINVLECRHLAWPSMNSSVEVQIDGQRNCTQMQRNSDCPYFNEYFTYEFFSGLEELMDKSVVFTVFQPRKVWTAKAILGQVTLDLALILAQPDHQFYHKWAALAAPSTDHAGGPRGYIKLDIFVLRKGEAPKIPNIDDRDTDEIDANVLLPKGFTMERQSANYIFNIYKGENLCWGKYLDSESLHPDKEPINAYVQICFAGLKVKTSVKRNKSNPDWNETLNIKEQFPPLCQRIKIQLCSSDSFKDTIIAVRYINLHDVSNDGEQGFLPTFGPSYLHFYAKAGNVEGCVGKIVISFHTEIQKHPYSVKAPTGVRQIDDLSKKNAWDKQLVLLYGIIFNANLVDKKFSDKPISYELNFGLSELEKQAVLSKDERVTYYRTAKNQPTTNGKIYWNVDYGQEKPCIFIYAYLPDFRKRMFLSNRISKIIKEAQSRIDEIETLITKEESKPSGEELNTLMMEVFVNLEEPFKKYIDSEEGRASLEGTNLDKERNRFCLQEMKNLLKSVNDHCNVKIKKQSFQDLQTIINQLKLLVEEAQDCWPEVYIIMLSGNKKVAWAKCPVRDLVYSPIVEECGQNCGKMQTLFLKSNSQKGLLYGTTAELCCCALDVLLWAGLESEKDACFETFPRGYATAPNLKPDTLPTSLVAQEKNYFQGRVYIYQGKFVPGSDRSGLCDPFARIVIGSKCRKTQVVRATLNPTWDETLIYDQITLYGDKSELIANPPLVIVQILDHDNYNQVEYIGHCTFKPTIKFIDDPNVADLLPTMHWKDVINRMSVMGEIFIAAEILENSEAVNVEPSNEIVRIPSAIKPHLVSYRVEALFWGVRELPRSFFLTVNRPKIIIECGYETLHSETIANCKQILNFTEPIKFVDVDLPEQENLAPPLCIKLFDCRSFGRCALIGTYVVSARHFMCKTITEDERYNLLRYVPSVKDQETEKISADKQGYKDKPCKPDFVYQRNI